MPTRLYTPRQGAFRYEQRVRVLPERICAADGSDQSEQRGPFDASLGHPSPQYALLRPVATQARLVVVRSPWLYRTADLIWLVAEPLMSEPILPTARL